MSLTIRRENLPVRCEICHQTDLFDPETGNCMRCVAAIAGAPLLRQDEAAVTDTKPDVSVEFAKRQKKSNFWILCILWTFVACQIVSILVTAEVLPGFLWLKGFFFSIFFSLGLISSMLFLSWKFNRCPNCNCWIPRNFRVNAKNCRQCGARLEW